MKKSHLLVIIIIAVSIGVIISTLQDSSTYATFTKTSANPGVEYHVIGSLNKEKEMHYDPEENANLFTFYVVDKSGVESKVIFGGTKPQDFERSEQIVIQGKMENNVFLCNKILMKCPSKYNNGQEEVEFSAVES
ncbi:MAG TPA: cytochrome c maturation protein CcmE [Flavobacteriales bacterium]|nr:cytochrome c maturation protein CcmE [Flavobacteriales bacterium]HIN39194.1 cytochrome c maturation protein CcmE [Flavobacteriales bacterium]